MFRHSLVPAGRSRRATLRARQEEVFVDRNIELVAAAATHVVGRGVSRCAEVNPQAFR